MTWGVNEGPDGAGSPFGALGIAMFMVIGGVLMVIREISAFIGMPW